MDPLHPHIPAVIKIRHQCHCATATAPPGEAGAEHVFEIDGVPFPYYITDAGPKVHKLAPNMYGVTITILCDEVDAVGVEQ